MVVANLHFVDFCFKHPEGWYGAVLAEEETTMFEESTGIRILTGS